MTEEVLKEVLLGELLWEPSPVGRDYYWDVSSSKNY